MLDLTKYEHAQMELPNMYGAYEIRDKDMYKDVRMTIHVHVKSFMEAAATKFPAWTFVGVRGYISQGDVEVRYRSFVVFDGRERLGTIEYTMNSKGEILICLSNDRIERSRERGRVMKTKDHKKALKVMQSSFNPKTLAEQMAEMTENTSRGLYSGRSENRYKFVDTYNKFCEHLAGHIFKYWPRYEAIAKANGLTDLKFANLPNAYQDYKITEDIWASATNKKGVFVINRGADYVVLDQGKESCGMADIQIMSGEGMPDWMRLGLGMLKLVEPKQFVRDIGYKLEDNSYFLINKEGQA